MREIKYVKFGDSRYLSSFVRDEKGSPVGYVVGMKVNETEFNIGMSLINPEHDGFDKEKAVKIAFGRASVYHTRKGVGAFRINPKNKQAMLAWSNMYSRCVKYFKGTSPTEYVKEGIDFVTTMS